MLHGQGRLHEAIRRDDSDVELPAAADRLPPQARDLDAPPPAAAVQQARPARPISRRSDSCSGERAGAQWRPRGAQPGGDVEYGKERSRSCCPVEAAVQSKLLSSRSCCPVEDAVQSKLLSSRSCCPVEGAVQSKMLSSRSCCPVEAQPGVHCAPSGPGPATRCCCNKIRVMLRSARAAACCTRVRRAA
jgi:hypothetical protein